jgi:hypothetical protein
MSEDPRIKYQLVESNVLQSWQESDDDLVHGDRVLLPMVRDVAPEQWLEVLNEETEALRQQIKNEQWWKNLAINLANDRLKRIIELDKIIAQMMKSADQEDNDFEKYPFRSGDTVELTENWVPLAKGTQGTVVQWMDEGHVKFPTLSRLSRIHPVTDKKIFDCIKLVESTQVKEGK